MPERIGAEPARLRSLLAAALILLPATAALGGSLPVLVAVRRRLGAAEDGRGLARLYAFDTLGATLGVLATIHFMLPSLGVVQGSNLAATMGVGAAGLAWMLREGDARESGEPGEPEPAPPRADRDPDDRLQEERWLLYLVIALTGLLGLGLEVVAVRVLAQVFSGTIYSFADLLAVWLLGTALGSGVYALLRRRAGAWIDRRPATVLVVLLVLQALVIAASALLARAAPTLLEMLAPTPADALDFDWVKRQRGEALTAALILGPATLVMGACFAHLLVLIAAPARSGPGSGSAPRSIGAALALNALAAAAAPFLFGLVAFEHLRYHETWALIAWAYLLLALAVAWTRRFPPRVLAPTAIGGAALILISSAAAGSLVLSDDPRQVEEGWVTLEQREGPLGVVSVSELRGADGPTGLRRLRVDRHFRMGGAMSIGERRMGHLPLLLGLDHDRDAGGSALFLGLGTGATAGAGLGPYGLDHVTAVELVPDVVDMLPYFADVNAGIADDPRVRVVTADARRFLLADGEQYQVIVADLFHPSRDGAGSLYASEHFAAARERLAPGGVFVQWLPLYQLAYPNLQLVLRTFLAEFPEAHAFLGLYNVDTPVLGLFGSVEPRSIDLAALRRVIEDPANAGLYQPLALTDVRDLFAGYLFDRAALLALADEGPVNDDLHPLLELQGPRFALGPETGAFNLHRLLRARVPWPDSLLRAEPEERAWLRARSAAFAEALDLYLEGESRLRAGIEPRIALAHHLAAYEREPEFLPPRPRLYAAAAADPELGEWLLPAMLARTPDEPRVHQAWLQ
ncbi:MAG: hypothetical protein KC431_17960, partial [Myxococcales bacterium]|nr:hypothetical protein [Myxococcales bacterium]